MSATAATRSGNFPPLWTEWNGKYRDTVRDFWRGEPSTPRRVRLPASPAPPTSTSTAAASRIASINFITAHDGFTLRDLVSYNDKHNEANGEDGRDGESYNRSWNCGAEGPTDDREINDLRLRQQKNFLTTLMVSQGVPMIAHGDELCRTQRGNNNVYCQDNATSWVDWDLGADEKALLEFTRGLVRLRRSHPVFRRRRFFAGSAEHGGRVLPRRHPLVHPGGRVDDRAGLGRRGRPHRSWSSSTVRRSPSPTPGARRSSTTTSSSSTTPRPRPSRSCCRPPEWGDWWRTEVDTAPDLLDPTWYEAGADVVVESRSLLVLRHPRDEAERPEPPVLATTQDTVAPADRPDHADDLIAEELTVCRTPQIAPPIAPVRAGRAHARPTGSRCTAASASGRPRSRPAYLASLGVSHLYLSPILQATPGSVHGYDVVDHNRLSAEAGGLAGFDRLAAAAREAGLGLVVDVVPNHMAVPTPAHVNAALWSLLKYGQDSPYAPWFDIDWDVDDGRILMPVLGQPARRRPRQRRARRWSDDGGAA